MSSEQHIFHRGQWKGKDDEPGNTFPNSFETFGLSSGAVEADVTLLADGETLAMGHIGDFKGRVASLERVTPQDFDVLTVAHEGREANAAPLFKEYLLGCFDRGITCYFEIKGETSESTLRIGEKIAETVASMIHEGAFQVDGKDQSILLQKLVRFHSISPEAVAATQAALARLGLELPVGLAWLSNPEFAKSNPLAVSALSGYHEGDSWEVAGLKKVQEVGGRFIFFIEPDQVTADLVEAAHAQGTELYVYVNPSKNSEALRKKLFDLKVDKLLY